MLELVILGLRHGGLFIVRDVEERSSKVPGIPGGAVEVGGIGYVRRNGTNGTLELRVRILVQVTGKDVKNSLLEDSRACGGGIALSVDPLKCDDRANKKHKHHFASKLEVLSIQMC